MKAQHTAPGRLRLITSLCFTLVFGSLALILASMNLGQKRKTKTFVIPKTWDAQAIDSFQMQLGTRRGTGYYKVPS